MFIGVNMTDSIIIIIIITIIIIINSSSTINIIQVKRRLSFQLYSIDTITTTMIYTQLVY